MEHKALFRHLTALGFDPEKRIDVKGRLSIADEFPASQKRCGIYFLEFTDHTYYIGQAVDVVRRFNDHRKNHRHLCGLWFQEVARKRLDEVEQTLIPKAERLKIPLINRTFVQNVAGETDLDLLMTPSEQENWLAQREPSSITKSELYGKVDLSYKLRYRNNFRRLKADPEYPVIRRFLNAYIRYCLPAWEKTEKSFWSLSCLPSTGRSGYQRLFCLNINSMEVFVFGRFSKDGSISCFLNLSDHFVNNEKLSLKGFQLKSKGVQLEKANYRAAAGAAYRAKFTDEDAVIRFTTKNRTAIRSIRELNLRLMRKGGTMYSPYHCFDLVKDVMKG